MFLYSFHSYIPTKVRLSTGENPPPDIFFMSLTTLAITMKGWPAHGDPNFPEFSATQDQLSIGQGTLLCGSRVVVPSKLRTRVLESLHEGHLGTVKMKSLAQS